MVPLENLGTIKTVYRMIFRSYPVFTGIVLTAALSASLSQAANGQASPGGISLSARAASAGASDADDSFSLPAESSLDIASDPAAAAQHSPETDDCIKRADGHFNSGRQMYFEGDLAGARREFDAAVDILLNAPDSLPDRSRIEP